MNDDGETKAEVAASARPVWAARSPASGWKWRRCFEHRTRHLRLTVPADTPAGLYALAVPRTEQVIVQDTEASELGLLAPESFQVRGDGVPYFFQVPQGLAQLRLVLSRPMEVRRPDGVAVVKATNQNVGEMTVPVERHSGLWSVFATFPGYVRLLNVEPVVAYGRRQALPAGAGAQPAVRFTPPPAQQTFVTGRAGQALHLAGSRRASFPEGIDGRDGYRYFPGNQGTVEFWFRPNWSTTELPVRGPIPGPLFFQAGSHGLQYRYGERSWSQELFATLSLSLRGVDEGAVGFTGRQFFRARPVVPSGRDLAAPPRSSHGTEGEFQGLCQWGHAGLSTKTDASSLPVQLERPRHPSAPERNRRIRSFSGPWTGPIEQLSTVSDVARYPGRHFTPPEQIIASRWAHASAVSS